MRCLSQEDLERERGAGAGESRGVSEEMCRWHKLSEFETLNVQEPTDEVFAAVPGYHSQNLGGYSKDLCSNVRACFWTLFGLSLLCFILKWTFSEASRTKRICCARLQAGLGIFLYALHEAKRTWPTCLIYRFCENWQPQLSAEETLSGWVAAKERVQIGDLCTTLCLCLDAKNKDFATQKGSLQAIWLFILSQHINRFDNAS